MEAIDVVYDTFIDECEIELCENSELPAVVNQRNPFMVHIEYNFNTNCFECRASYKCRDNDGECVNIGRDYSSGLVAQLSAFYKNAEE